MITAEHVKWAYRLFLDREAESPQVVQQHLRDNQTTEMLRSRFMTSLEFKAHAPMRRCGPTRSVIYQTAMGFRMCLNLADFVVSGAVLNDGYEPHETDFIRRTVRPGQVVLDIGANIGYFTLLMAHLVGAAGYVYAFEPREDLCGFVKRSIAENHYEDRCAIFTCALGDFEGVCNFRMAGKSGLDPSDPNYHSSCYLAMNEAGGDKHEFCDVEVKILDCLLSDSFDKRVAFIKIDAEGAEHMIFRGARNLLKRDKPIILSEVFEPLLRDVSKADAVTYVKSVTAFGYECYVFENGALTPMGSVERFFKSEASRVKPVNVVFNPAK